MNYLLDALRWVADPANATGPGGYLHLIWQHLGYTLLGVVVAMLVALPIGLYVGHTGRFRSLAVLATGLTRALPTLGLMTLLALMFGIGLVAPTLAFVVLAVPSILAGAYSGLESVPRSVVDGARAQGMTELQILSRVEIPLGLQLILGGIRSAFLQVLATAMLASYVGNGGLGKLIFLGLKSSDYPMMLAGSVLVVILAITSDLALAALQRSLRPKGVARPADALTA